MRLGLLELRIAVIGVSGLIVFCLVYAVASALIRVASRLGMWGLVRRRALESNPAWAQIEPFVRWLGVRVSGLISEETAQRIDAQIALAGDYLGLTAEESVALSILTCIGGGVMGALAAYLS